MKTGTYVDVLSDFDMSKKRRWLVTGGAGFIGSHLVEALLSVGQDVAALDNFSTGSRANLDAAVRSAASNGSRKENAGRFEFFEGDIRDKGVCKRACEGADVVFHLAAYISVPGSVADPDLTHSVNVEGFFNLLQAARECGAGRFVYASSSAVYGDDPILPKVEDRRGRLLSPYAVTKLIDELYAESWGTVYGMDCVGLRYFNVFGPRQDPNGPYAAVIPRWAHALRHGEPVTIFGDGQTSRDFCYVKDVVRANLLAATTKRREAVGEVCNIACGVKTTLNELFAALKRQFPSENALPPVHEDFRRGDIAHSLASIERARALLGYSPLYSLEEGLREMLGESSTPPRPETP